MLSANDAQHYAQAFAAMHRGDFGTASALSGQVADPCLRGRLAAARLLNPDYRASYAELSGWMLANADLPEAQRVYDLALKRKPASAPAPRQPLSAAADVPSAVSLGERVSRSLQARPAAESRGQAAAREAFYAGDMERAYGLGASSGERWIAGLSATRLKRYPEALRALEPLSADVRQSPWTRSGAAYWGARAALAAGEADHARALLKVAARSPDTFYGLIAARELDRLSVKAPKADAIADLLDATGLDPAASSAFVHADPAARRAAALIQIGLPLEAGEELRNAMATASEAQRPKLTALAIALNAPLGGPDPAKAGWARFDLGSFPTPVLTPTGGFVIDKALVYALVRQESRFNPNAASGSAYGLMQLTAETAARLAGDETLRHNPSALRDPAPEPEAWPGIRRQAARRGAGRRAEGGGLLQQRPWCGAEARRQDGRRRRLADAGREHAERPDPRLRPARDGLLLDLPPDLRPGHPDARRRQSRRQGREPRRLLRPPLSFLLRSSVLLGCRHGDAGSTPARPGRQVQRLGPL